MNNFETTTAAPFDSSFFESTTEKASEIGEQNERYDKVQADPELLGQYSLIGEAAVSGIALEQAGTMQELKTIDMTPYEQLGIAELAVLKELENLNRQFALAEAEYEQKLRELHEVAQRAGQLSPLGKEGIRLAYQHYLDQISNDTATTLKDEISAKESEAIELRNLMSTLEGEENAWELPRVPQPEIFAPDEDRSIAEIEDILPGEPEICIRDENKTIKKLIEQYGTTKGASVMATAFLMTQVGKILEPLDIASHVYAGSRKFDEMEDDVATHSMHQGVLCLLNPNSGIVFDMLQKEGYMLVYGDRILRDQRGKQLGSKRRIYTVYELNNNSFIEPLIEEVDTSKVAFKPLPRFRGKNTSDQEAEIAATDSDIEKIEQSVEPMTAEQVQESMVQQYIEDARLLIPWLIDKKVIRDNVKSVNPQRLKAVFMNKRAIRDIPVKIANPHDLAQGYKDVDTNANYRTPSRIVNAMIYRKRYSILPRDVATEAYTQVCNIIDSYFQNTESKE